MFLHSYGCLLSATVASQITNICYALRSMCKSEVLFPHGKEHECPTTFVVCNSNIQIELRQIESA